MPLFMHLSISIRDKSFTAVFAFVFLLTGMNFNMVSQAILELEPLSTNSVWALIAVKVAKEI